MNSETLIKLQLTFQLPNTHEKLAFNTLLIYSLLYRLGYTNTQNGDHAVKFSVTG